MLKIMMTCATPKVVHDQAVLINTVSSLSTNCWWSRGGVGDEDEDSVFVIRNSPLHWVGALALDIGHIWLPLFLLF